MPEPLDESYEILEEKLKEWVSSGFIRVFIENDERMIEFISIPEK